MSTKTTVVCDVCAAPLPKRQEVFNLTRSTEMGHPNTGDRPVQVLVDIRPGKEGQDICKDCALRALAAVSGLKLVGDGEIRPSVIAFAKRMEHVLREHVHKKGNQNGANGRPGWRSDPPADLMKRLQEEVCELRDEILLIVQGRESVTRIAAEAVDVGNFAMMVWDRVLQLPEATDPS